MSRTKFFLRPDQLLVTSLIAWAVGSLPGCGSEDGGLEPAGGRNSGGVSGGATTSGNGGTEVRGGNSSAGRANGGALGQSAGAAGSAGDGSDLGGATHAGAAGAAGVADAGGMSGSGTATLGGTTSLGGSESGGSPSPGSGGTLSNGGSVVAEGGMPDVGVGGEGGNSGEGPPRATNCIFHTQADPVQDPDGAGGAGPTPTILSAKNAFAGNFLTDGEGRALYTYGVDSPGDCEVAPVSNCTQDCAIAWPPFNGEPRVLGPGLDPTVFGVIQGPNGPQTTYRGWPLYYYKNDAAPGDVKGHAVGRIWALAQVVLPNLTVMRNGSARYVATGDGFALYASAADTVGADQSLPQSSCSGSCLREHPLFAPSYISPVSYLNAVDFGYFLRGDGKVQLAYKGAPLYYSPSDAHPGTRNGVLESWTLVTP